MPNRILREGIITSPRIARLSGWADEVFYRRLMSVVDDFGRFHADPGLLRAACYPRQLNKVSDSDIGKWLTACVTAALVRVYPASDGESYLQLLDFRQQTRAKESRFPAPDSVCIADATHTPSNRIADAPVYGDGDVYEDGDGKKPRARRATLPCPDDVSAEVWADWLALRKAKRAPVTATVVAASRREAAKAGMAFEAFLAEWCARGSQGLRAEWVQQAQRAASQAPGVNGAAQSFRERDAAALAAKVASLTGGRIGVAARRTDERTEVSNG